MKNILKPIILLSTILAFTPTYSLSTSPNPKVTILTLKEKLANITWNRQDYLGTGGKGTAGITESHAGSADKPGLYALLIRMAPNSFIATHTHSKIERVVVLEGSIRFAASNKLNIQHKKCLGKKENCAEHHLNAQSYAEIPAEMPHYLYNPKHAKTNAIVLVYFNAPFNMIYLDPKDNPQQTGSGLVKEEQN